MVAQSRRTWIENVQAMVEKIENEISMARRDTGSVDKVTVPLSLFYWECRKDASLKEAIIALYKSDKEEGWSVVHFEQNDNVYSLKLTLVSKAFVDHQAKKVSSVYA